MLWVTNVKYWNHKCSHLQVDLDNLQKNVAQSASDAFVPVDEKPFWDVSSGTSPINGSVLLPGFTHHEQFQVLTNLIQMRAHYATKTSTAEHDKHELHLVAVHASIFQRFAWHYFANADINEAFLDTLLKETMTTTSRAISSAGAEGDEDVPLPRPKKTRKRRPEETQQGPARRPHATDVPEHPPHPTIPKGRPAESGIKPEPDVEMEHSTTPVPRDPQHAPTQEPPVQAPGGKSPPYVPAPSPDAAPRASASAPPPNIETAPLPAKVECKEETPSNPVRIPKAYPGRQPPPPSRDAASSSTTQPKPYKEMPRKAIPASLLPSDLPMPGFLAPQNPPPPKARPRQRTPPPTLTPRAGYTAPSDASPRTREKAAVIARDVGEYISHDAGLLCTKHGLNEQHIPNELRFMDEGQKILPNIAVFLSKSFFENPRQEKPRRGFGSSLVLNGQHNSDTEWPTGYYCLFCRMKNKINANTWGKPFSTLAALLSHGAGSNCIPIAYLCLLRKQYHWHRAMIATHIITHSAFVGDKAVKDETRHPQAELPRIWNIFTTKGECDPHCQVPPPPGPEDPRRHGDSARGAASSNAPLFRPTHSDPLPNLNRHNDPPPTAPLATKIEYTKSGLKQSEREWHLQEFPDDPDSSGSSMEEECNEFSFIALLRTARFPEFKSTMDIPLKFCAKPVSPSLNTKQHSLIIPTGATVREIYDAGYRLFRAVPMRAARKLTHRSDFKLLPTTAAFLCAVPRTSGTFATQFQEFDPAPLSTTSPPPAEPEEEDEDSDSAQTAKSAHTPPDEPTSPAGPQHDDEGCPVFATKPIPEFIDLDENQVDPAARPDGGSLSDSTPNEIVLLFNPLCNIADASDCTHNTHPPTSNTQAFDQVQAPLDGGIAADTAITCGVPWPILWIISLGWGCGLLLRGAVDLTFATRSRAQTWYSALLPSIPPVFCTPSLSFHYFGNGSCPNWCRFYFGTFTSITCWLLMIHVFLQVLDDGPVQHNLWYTRSYSYAYQRFTGSNKLHWNDPLAAPQLATYDSNIAAGVIREFNCNYPATEIAFIFDLRGFLGYILYPDPHHDVLFRRINEIAPYTVDRICEASELPKEFINASRNLDRHFTIVLCCDNSVPGDCPLALALNEPTGDITNFNQLRAVWYPTTVVSEVLLRKPLGMPRFWHEHYLWPWVNSWTIPPYEHSIVQDGFYVRFCPCDRIGRTLKRVDIMRDRMLNFALSAIPPSLPSARTTPAPSTYQADPEREERREEDASSTSSEDTFRTPADGDESTQTASDSQESSNSDASHVSVSAGAGADSGLDPTGDGRPVEHFKRDQHRDADVTLATPSDAKTSHLLPILVESGEAHDPNLLTPEARQRKRQRASRRRVVLADDAIHTDSTEDYIAKRPHITRSLAVKELRSHRLDRWLEQQERDTSTSSIQTSVNTQATTIVWSPILGTTQQRPELARTATPCISPRKLFVDEQREVPLGHDKTHDRPPDSQPCNSNLVNNLDNVYNEETLQAQRPHCIGGMKRSFDLPSIDQGQMLLGPLSHTLLFTLRKDLVSSAFLSMASWATGPSLLNKP